MRHNFSKHIVFHENPVSFDKNTERELLQYCLGGTLYMPSTRQIADKIIKNSIPELTSMVMCFEDAISLNDLPFGEANVIEELDNLHRAYKNKELSIDNLPLIFLRVRDIKQFSSFAKKLSNEHVQILTGFVFPKFYSDNATEYLEQLDGLNKKFGTKLYGMPILEGESIANVETRVSELKKLKLIIDPFKDIILNIRVGGTDFSSLFGVRRGVNTSIYDILPVRDIISDILNFFCRISDEYTVSAPVWEYFLAYSDDNIDKYIGNSVNRSLISNEVIVNQAIDGLLREVTRDITNGMIGKTVIHPSHLRFVHSMQAITKEEYEDALQIINSDGGVMKSKGGNKMNEVGPHKSWATKVCLRAKVYGVIKNENDYLNLFKR